VSQINAKSVVKYVVMPGIIPRARELFTSGFSWIAFLIATIYGMVRLLPAGHPYLDPRNKGLYNTRQVIAAAANNLVLKKENWDQILIFAAILTGVVILVSQVFLIISAMLFQPVFAQGFTGSIFMTPAPIAGGDSKDVAFLLLDRVFGIPDFFCGAGDTCTNVLSGGRWPIHVALHEMFKFYSTGLLIIAVLIVLYYIVVLVAETANTGTPFGDRFKNVWVPIRLVVGLALLVPVNYGLNSAQYITLYAAKVGSGLATNGWHRFNNTIRDTSGDSARANPTGETSTLLGLPVEPSLSPLVKFMSLVHGCAYGEWKANNEISGGTLKYGMGTKPPNNGFYVKPYFVKNPVFSGSPTEDVSSGTSYQNALSFYNNGNITIVFGRDVSGIEDKKGKYLADIEPTCGSVRIGINDISYTDSGDIGTYGGAPAIQEFYFNLVKQMWYGESVAGGGTGMVHFDGASYGLALSNDLLIDLSHRYVELNMKGSQNLACSTGNYGPIVATGSDCNSAKPSAMSMTGATMYYQSALNAKIKEAWENYNQNGVKIRFEDELYDRGWAGAGIWYNTISQVNGAFVSAVSDIPSSVEYPLIMEEVSTRKSEKDSSVEGREQYNPTTSEGTNIASDIAIKEGEKKAAAMYDLLTGWETSGSSTMSEERDESLNPFITGINLIFGTHGLFAMRGENATIHPMAQLSTLGKGIVNSAILSIVGSTALSVLGGMGGGFGALMDIISSLLNTVAFIGLTAGVILFYILPLLPFIYFFFAVGNWIKGLFEAMVGVPLWALAHIRLEGEGLPGSAAESGYYLIFESMIRPILIVFGLVAASVIFTAQVRALNFIWDLVVDNVGAFETTSSVIDGTEYELQRSVIDQFFFTVLYAIIVYLMASASFKLIDLIPNNIMRFIGSGVSSFGDSAENAAKQLEDYAGRAGLVQGQQLVDATRGVGKGLGGMLSSAVKPGQGG